MAHWRRRYHAGPGWVERGTAAFLGWLGLLGYCGILLFGLWLIFVTTPKARASTCQPGQSEHLAELAAELKVKPSRPEHIAVMSDCQGRTYDMVKVMLEAVRRAKERK